MTDSKTSQTAGVTAEQISFDEAGFLLKNPNRGLRGETYITLGENIRAYPGEKEDPFERARRLIEKYAPDSPQIFQTYVYLCDYADRPLDELAFEQLEKFFRLFCQSSVRILLRFAYSTESQPDAPYKTVRLHLGQIEKWFKDNARLIEETVFCLQTGIIGFWGEGHSYKNLKKRHIKKVIADVCRIAPEGIYNQVRTYPMLKKVPDEYAPFVGIHDDYIIGDPAHKWAFIPSRKKKKYAFVINRARFTVNDGEMPWGRATLNDKPGAEPLDSLDGISVAKQLMKYSLTTFSLEHNYREDEGKIYSMEKWKNEYLSLDEARKCGITVNPNLFRDRDCSEIKLCIYDIIRYHLGYQLALSDLYITQNAVSFDVTNYGFTPPLTFYYFAAVFRDKESGKLIERKISAYSRTKLLSGKTVSYKAEIPFGCEAVGVKLETRPASGICARFANSAPFENGVQYFSRQSI